MTGAPNNNLSPKKLKVGYWVATHRAQLRMVGIGVLAAIAVITVISFFVQLFIYISGIAGERTVHEQVATSTINFNGSEQIDDVIITKAESVIRDDSSIDVVVALTNINNTWAAIEYQYDVIVAGSSAGRDTVVLAPGQTIYITRMNVPFSGDTAPSVQVEELNTEWQNYPITKLPNESWSVSEEAFRFIRNENEQAASFQSELRFTLQNESVYGFVTPEVVVLLRNAEGTLMGIGSANLNQISPLEERALTFRWPRQFGTGMQSEVHISVDKITDESIITD